MIGKKIEKLASEINAPCVTISLNTHRTHPDNAQDDIVLKNLLKEAEERILVEFNKKSVAPLLEKLSAIQIDSNHNLDSLHIFLSNDTKEIIKLPLPTQSNTVQISNTFAIRTLIKSLYRTEEYLILLLSQGGVSLYHAVNDEITEKIRNDDFPFSENPFYETDREKRSDSERRDNLVREYFNSVDKALISVHNRTDLHCVVICTEENYSLLMQIADKPSVYLGCASIDYNETGTHHIAKQAAEVIEKQTHNRKKEAIDEMKQAVSQGLVSTDLQEIFQASLDGRGDLLIVRIDYAQSVIMTGDRTFDLTQDSSGAGVIDDITSNIAWSVLSKNGRVIFTTRQEISELGDIVLKLRY